jgi:predicted metal-binding membrane protein
MNTQPSSRTFIGTSALLFIASAALTVVWCESMAAMQAMPMAGGWTMSMMWMRMPGQTWPGAATAFLGMWCVMMLAMMLPSLMPMLARYRRSILSASSARLALLTLQVGAGYFAVWALVGAIVFVIGTVLALVEMELPLLARAVPAAAGVIVVAAGALQFSTWKLHHLACCRNAQCGAATVAMQTAWRHGLRLGMHCVHCCFGLTAVLLVIGVMDLRAMAVVTAAISAERLVPGGERTARVIGVLLVVAGLFQLMHAAAA